MGKVGRSANSVLALSIFMVGLIVPSNDPDLLRSMGTAAQSPFVIAAMRAGIKVIPSIINAIVLTSAWSAGNSGMFRFLLDLKSAH
jgi:amino acid transporter